MKKIFTSLFFTLFCAVVAMAQDVTLGALQYKIGSRVMKDGSKVRAENINFTVFFPNATGVNSDTQVLLDGYFEGLDESEFEGMNGTIDEGVNLGDFEGFEATTTYTLKITKVVLGVTTIVPEEGATAVDSLTFTTRGAERKTSWTFTIDSLSTAYILDDLNLETPAYWARVKDGSDDRFYYTPALSDAPMMVNDSIEMPMTEDLLFTAKGSYMIVGNGITNSSYYARLQLNANNIEITIPDLKVGDVITFNANRATKATSSKFTTIYAETGATAPSGYESSRGVQDSIQLGSSFADFKFVSTVDGDVTFTFSNCLLASINIEEGRDAVDYTYTVSGVYSTTEDSVTTTTVLKNFVENGSSSTDVDVTAYYSYWLMDGDGNIYTAGAKGSPFSTTFSAGSNVTAENNDTTYTISYSATDYTGAIFCSEAEDLEGVLKCTHANCDIRSSAGVSAYNETDITVCTLPAGSYKVKAILFDGNKTASYTPTFSVGTAEDAETISFAATATNWTEVESDLITVTEETPLIWNAGGGDSQGLDIIFVYATEDAPEEETPDAIAGVAEDETAAAQTKVMVDKNGRIVIVTANGVYNAAGARIK